MKNTFFKVALIAMAIGSYNNAQAQAARAIKGDFNISCSATTSNTGQTVLDGAWGITTDKAGNLVITDKDNTVVRMVADGGKTVIAEQGSVSSANYPFALVVDKCGNLHITDNTIYSGGGKQTPAVLLNDQSTWGDPDMPSNTGFGSAPVAITTK
jgi:hypothetical protein